MYSVSVNLFKYSRTSGCNAMSAILVHAEIIPSISNAFFVSNHLKIRIKVI